MIVITIAIVQKTIKTINPLIMIDESIEYERDEDNDSDGDTDATYNELNTNEITL